MGFQSPQQISQIAADNGVKKASFSLTAMLILGFLGGAFISIGYLLSIRITAGLPPEWATLGNLIGGAVFPIGLILVVIAGGELVTGNMMTVAMGFFTKRVTLSKLMSNWIIITVANFVGALFVAYVFGHLVGLTETEPYLHKTIATAQGKVDASFIQVLLSGIGCNWLVGLAIWMAYSAEDISGKIIGIWFPIMAFVAIGFQHVVANMFVIPAAIFAGSGISWGDYFANFVPVFIGNVIGGAIFVSAAYWGSYLKNAPLSQGATNQKKKAS